MKSKSLNIRWGMLCVGTLAMLFAGVIYAWSILKAPFAEELGFSKDALSLCFTLTMCCFCLGGFFSSFIVKHLGTGVTVALAGLIAGFGFVLTSFVDEGGELLLYLTYSVLSGLGIGMAYIVIISTVNSWFPDKKGFSSGALMMGFGASTLILGNLADLMFEMNFGWRGTFIIFGVALALVIGVSAIFIKKPGADIALPPPKAPRNAKAESFEVRDYKPTEMIKRFSFWRTFIGLVSLTAVGSSVISFAKDLALSVGAGAALATTLVGVLAVCNGLGRIIIGAVFDYMGRKFTMILSSALTILAAGITLLAVGINSLPICIVGLCLTGMSYGCSPTVSSAFTSAFYGKEHFATNLSLMNFNLIGASFTATLASALLSATGGYTVPFIMLLSLAVLSLVMNMSIKKP